VKWRLRQGLLHARQQSNIISGMPAPGRCWIFRREILGGEIFELCRKAHPASLRMRTRDTSVGDAGRSAGKSRIGCEARRRAIPGEFIITTLPDSSGMPRGSWPCAIITAQKP